MTKAAHVMEKIARNPLAGALKRSIRKSVEKATKAFKPPVLKPGYGKKPLKRVDTYNVDATMKSIGKGAKKVVKSVAQIPRSAARTFPTIADFIGSQRKAGAAFLRHNRAFIKRHPIKSTIGAGLLGMHVMGANEREGERKEYRDRKQGQDLHNVIGPGHGLYQDEELIPTDPSESATQANNPRIYEI